MGPPLNFYVTIYGNTVIAAVRPIDTEEDPESPMAPESAECSVSDAPPDDGFEDARERSPPTSDSSDNGRERAPRVRLLARNTFGGELARQAPRR